MGGKKAMCISSFLGNILPFSWLFAMWRRNQQCSATDIIAISVLICITWKSNWSLQRAGGPRWQLSGVSVATVSLSIWKILFKTCLLWGVNGNMGRLPIASNLYWEIIQLLTSWVLVFLSCMDCWFCSDLLRVGTKHILLRQHIPL